MGELILHFTTVFPTISKTGKHSKKLVTVNSIPHWYRYKKTEVKNNFKESLGSWTIPEYDKEPHKSGTVEFTLLRHNNRRIDADSCTFVGKWLVDFLVERGYFLDDNEITFIYRPALMNQDVVETSINVKVYANEQINRNP